MGGRKIIDHHDFLLMLYWLIGTFCSRTFVEHWQSIDIEYNSKAKTQESLDCLLSVEAMYTKYYLELESSTNGHMRLCAFS